MAWWAAGRWEPWKAMGRGHREEAFFYVHANPLCAVERSDCGVRGTSQRIQHCSSLSYLYPYYD